jgi:hypothetical protein
MRRGYLAVLGGIPLVKQEFATVPVEQPIRIRGRLDFPRAGSMRNSAGVGKSQGKVGASTELNRCIPGKLDGERLRSRKMRLGEQCLPGKA